MPSVSEPFAPFEIKYPSGACMAPLGLLTDTTISAQAKIVYIRLTRYAGKDGVCRPSETVLAGELGLSSRRLRDKLRRLEAAEYIRCRRRGWGKSQEYGLLWHPRFENIKVSQCGHPEGADRTVSSGQLPSNGVGLVPEQGNLFTERTLSSGQQFQSPSERTLSSGQQEGPDRTVSSALTGQFRPVSGKVLLKGDSEASRSDWAGRQAVTPVLSENQPAASLPAQDATLVSNLNTRMEALETQLAIMTQVQQRVAQVLERLTAPPTAPVLVEASPPIAAPSPAPTLPIRPEVETYLNSFTRTMGEPPPAVILSTVSVNLAGASLDQYQTQVERRMNGGLKPTSWTMFALWARDVGLAKEAWANAPPPARKPVMSAAERAAEAWKWAEERINARNRERTARAAAARTG